MTEIQNRDALHSQDGMHGEGHPGYETPEECRAEDYAAVRVHVTNPVATTTGATQFGVYETIVIPAASVQQVLPRDPLRQYAYITAVDAPVVLSVTQEQAQSTQNLAALVPFPQGAYLQATMTTPPIRHNDPVYAVNTSAAAACRVVVYVERGSVTG
jgi:hypothetical protein